MKREIEARTRGGGRRKEREKPQRAKPPCYRASEREQPHGIEPKMQRIAVDQRMGDEGPYLRREPTREPSVGHYHGVVARRNEREQQQHLVVGRWQEQELADEMDGDQDGKRCDNHGRYVEDGFGSGFHACRSLRLALT